MIDDSLLKKAVLESLRKINETMNLDPEESAADSERAKQDFISKKIDSVGVRKKDSSKKEGEEVEEKDEEEPEKSDDKDIRDKFEKGEDKSLKGKDDKFSYDVKPLPKDPKFQDAMKQLNFIRSGASASDNDIKKGLLQYFDNLKDTEKKDLVAMMSGFATIMNRAGDVEDAPKPSDYENKSKEEKLAPVKGADIQSDKPVVKKPEVSPIVVGERADTRKERSLVFENNKK